MKKCLLAYLGLVALCAGGIALFLHAGALRTVGITSPLPVPPPAASPASGSLAILLLQIILISLAAKGMGALFRRLRQPAVVGEMFAGLLLGPSVFGAVAPGPFHFFFAPATLGPLYLLSQLGIILFLFAVGAELDPAHLRHRLPLAIGVSHASIVVPYLFGVGFAFFTYRELAPAGISFISFALFLGIAMSITAFPVLARILSERGLSGTPLGIVALTCAALNDLTAWILLALVIAVAQAHGSTLAHPAWVVIGAVALGLLLFGVIRPLLRHLLRRPGTLSKGAIATGLLLFALACAVATEKLGLHPLFGAFLAGILAASLPEIAEIRRAVVGQVQEFGGALLLPLFFAFTGLRTELPRLDTLRIWELCLVLIALAVAGKWGGTYLAARTAGMARGEASALGILMNTRGLMELVVLNIGYDLGIIPPVLFSMLIVMALATTLMTGPLLDRALKGRESF